MMSMTPLGDDINLRAGVATSTPPSRGCSITSPPGITPLVLGVKLSEDKRILYKPTAQEYPEADEPAMADMHVVDQALTNVLSLPQALSQVTQKFKDHSFELERLKQHLTEKKTIFDAEKKRLQDMVYDVRSSERKIYLGEDREDQIKQVCQQYQCDLNEILHLIHQVKEEVMLSETEIDMLTSRLQKYEDKTTQHVQRVSILDQNIDTFRQLNKQRESTGKLEMQKKTFEEDGESKKVLNGGSEAELRDAIGVMKEALKQIESNFNNQQQKVSNCKSQQQQLQTDISVLHKRNAAQMTRIKRQVKEVNTSNKHWQDQASYLKTAIQQLKSEEFQKP